MIRRTGWVVMTALAILIAGYALLALVLPGFGPPFIADHRSVVPVWLTTHLAGGLTALALGPWQLNQRLRHRALGLHRWMGRGYVGAVLVGGLGSLGLAPLSQEGFVTHVGFGMLGILWLVATVQAYLRIRAGDQAAHRQWMIRSYALTLAAVTLRVYLPLSQVFGIPFGEAYQAVTWVCWVPNLVVAEWLILRRGGDLPRCRRLRLADRRKNGGCLGANSCARGRDGMPAALLPTPVARIMTLRPSQYLGALAVTAAAAVGSWPAYRVEPWDLGSLDRDGRMMVSAFAEIGFDDLLHDATVYSTREPCPMDAGTIVLLRIRRVVFCDLDTEWGGFGSAGNQDRYPHRVAVSRSQLPRCPGVATPNRESSWEAGRRAAQSMGQVPSLATHLLHRLAATLRPGVD